MNNRLRASRRAGSAACCVAAAMLLAGAPTVAAPVWRTGAEFRRTLSDPAGVTWKSTPLRRALRSLSTAQRMAIFLDRRVDPGREIDYEPSGIPLRELIDGLAAQEKLAASYLRSLVYIGPPETASKLATLVELRRQEARDLPLAIKRRLFELRPWRWEELTTPRQLLAELESQYGIKIIGGDKMPHDLWPAADLPPLNFIERLSVVLAGFHVTFRFRPDGSAVELIPIPANVHLEHDYDVGPSAPKFARQIGEFLPAAKITPRGNQIHVAALVEDHEKIRRLLAGEGGLARRTVEPIKPDNPPAGGASDSVKVPRFKYSLQATNVQPGAIVKAVAGKLKKKLVFEDEGVYRILSSNRFKTFNVKDVSHDEMLRKALDKFNLTYRITETDLQVLRKKR